MIDFNTEVGFTPTIANRGRDPFTSQMEIDELVDQALMRVFGGFLSGCELVATNTGNPCDDFSACTLDEICDPRGFCTAQNEINSFCQFTQCRECNPVTGACDGVSLPSFPCFSGCAENGASQKEGFCTDMAVCEPEVLDESLCGLTGDENACKEGTCTSVYTGPVVTTPVGVQLPLSSVDAGLDFLCGERDFNENQPCETEANEDNLCVFSEKCVMGECVPDRQSQCENINSFNVCANTTLSVCNPLDGSCVAVGLPNGTPCDTDDVCFFNQTCLTEPPIGGIPSTPMCVGTPTINCTAELEKPCVFASICRANPSTGEAECLNDILPNGVSCTIAEMPTVDAVCNQGVCVPNDCPQPTEQCKLPARDPITGDCTFVDAPNNAPCTDNLKCTNDICLSGNCVSTPIDCLPVPAECLVVAGCSESQPGDGCLYDPAADGTACMNDLGQCSGGICFAICDPPCQNGGVCFFSGGQPVCDCPPGFEGPACETASAPPAPSMLPTFTFGDVRSIFYSSLALVVAIILLAWVISAGITVCCSCFGDDYEPDIRIAKKKKE